MHVGESRKQCTFEFTPANDETFRATGKVYTEHMACVFYESEFERLCFLPKLEHRSHKQAYFSVNHSTVTPLKKCNMLRATWAGLIAQSDFPIVMLSYFSSVLDPVKIFRFLFILCPSQCWGLNSELCIL